MPSDMTERETALLHLLVEKLDGFSVDLVSVSEGRRAGFSVGRNRSIALRDVLALADKTRPADAPNPSPAAEGGEARVEAAYREGHGDALMSSMDVGTAWDVSTAKADLEALATPSPQPADAVRKALTKLIDAANAMGDACNCNLCDEAIAEGRTALASDPAPAGEAVEPDDPNLWHFWNEKARWLAVKLATAERERDDARKALKSAAVSLERAAGRFNMMGGVGLVNGVNPKVGYAEACEASRSARAASREGAA